MILKCCNTHCQTSILFSNNINALKIINAQNTLDCSDRFIFFFYGNGVCSKLCCFCTGKAKTARTPKSVQKTEKRPPSLCDSPVFLSDSDDDSDIVIQSTWRTRHSRPPSEEHHATSTGREDTAKPCALPPALTVTTHTGPEDTCSSEEEFQSLLDRVRQNQNLGSRTPASPRPPPGTAHMVSVLFGGIDLAKGGKIGYLKYSGFTSKFLEQVCVLYEQKHSLQVVCYVIDTHNRAYTVFNQ